MYSLAKQSGIAYSTLNDLANGRVDILNCKLALAVKLSRVLGISVDELCDIAAINIKTYSKEYDVQINVTVRNKTFYAQFVHEGINENLELCPVDEDTSFFIEDISRWTVEDKLLKKKIGDK